MSSTTKLPDVKRSLNRTESSKLGKLKEQDSNSRPKSGTGRDHDPDSLSSAYADLKEKHDQRKEAFDQVLSCVIFVR